MPAAKAWTGSKNSTREYLATGHELATKVSARLRALCDQPVALAQWKALQYFPAMLRKQLDLVDRRLLRHETIPAAEKVYSLFEPPPNGSKKAKRAPL